MKKLDLTLGVLEITSVSLGYRALDQITRETSATVLEASAQGGGLFLILLNGEEKEVRRAETLTQKVLDATGTSALRDREVIVDVSAKLIETFYSLHTSQLQDSLLILETETISAMFALSQRMMKSHLLDPIEIRSARGGISPGGLAFFTGGKAVCSRAADDARMALTNSARTGIVELIENPAEAFKNFFNLANL